VSAAKTAGAFFSEWISTEIRPFLAERGWTRSGLVFSKPYGSNTGLVQFRRWKWNTSETCRFSIQVGVFSPRFAAWHAEWAGTPVPCGPALVSAAAVAPLSALMGEREEVFWTMRAPSLSFELAALGESVRDKLAAFALPFVEAHASDEQMRDEMLAQLDQLGPSQVGWLTRLLADIGPEDRIPEVRDRLAPSETRLAAQRDEAERRWRAADDADAAAADEAMLRLARRRPGLR
jgi:hypothetical protein